MTRAFVTFWLGTEEYAFDVDHVVEITRLGHLTSVPGSTAELAGVITWRGRAIPVIDVAARLKRDPAPPDERKGRLLILKRPGPFAVAVDRAGEIIDAEFAKPVDGLDELDRERIRLFQTPRGILRVLEPTTLIGAGARLMEEYPC
jgi:chemotaxis signal transduction protein